MTLDLTKYTTSRTRPIPVILLLDGSGSMSGEKMATLNGAVNEMIASFKNVEQMETEIQLAIIRFGGNVELTVPLQPIADITNITLESSGNTPMGVALAVAKDLIEDKEIIPSKGYRPTVVLISDGQPTDSYEIPMKEFISTGRSSKCDRIAMAIGEDAKHEILQEFLAGTKNKIFTASDASKIKDFFRMVTMSVSVRAQSIDPNKLLAAPAVGVSQEDYIKKLDAMLDF